MDRFLDIAPGSVFTARQVETNLTVTIKQMDFDKQPNKDYILNEIMVLRALKHPNIFNIIDSFLYKNELWLVMEYVEDGSLTDVLTTNSMSMRQIAAVSREACTGIEYLHSQGIIHRDIKSKNVLLTLRGDVKLSA